jgi:trigger factor
MSNDSSIKSYDLQKKDLNCDLKAVIDAEAFKKLYNKKLSEVLRRFEAKGFRKGKVPRQMLESRHGEALLHESAQEMIDESFKVILEKEATELACQPKLKRNEIKLGKDLEYDIEFECMPVISKIDYSKLEVEQPVIKLTDKDLEERCQEEIKKAPIWAESKKAIEDGSKVKIDFKGTIDGKVFEGGEGTGVEVVIGDGKFLKDFETGLKGAKKGDQKSIEVTFPETYHQRTLCGKKASFDINVIDVWSASYHNMDQAWFKLCGSKATNKKDFLAEMKEREQKSADRIARKIVIDRISDLLTEKADFLVPKALVESELKNTGVEGEPTKEQLTKAEKSVRYLLILQNAVKEFGVNASPVELENYLDSVIPQGIDRNFFKSWYVQDEERVNKIRMAVLEEKALDRIKESCKLKDKETSLAKAKKMLEKED